MATERAAAKAPERVEHKFVELIPPNLGIDFVRMKFRMLIVSWSLIAVGLLSIWAQGGLNYGIDFRGGTMIHVKFPQATSATDIRGALSNPDMKEVLVQEVGQTGT